MPNILQTLLDTYQQNPAAALALIPELGRAVEDGKIVELPCPFYSAVYAIDQLGKEIIYGELLSTNKEYCLIVNLEGTLTSKGKTWKGVQVKKQDVYLTREAAEHALKEREKNG